MSIIPGAPKIMAPINEWMDTIPVQGCLGGAQVSIVTLKKDGTADQVIAKGNAGGGSDNIPLTGGIPLKAGQRLKAMQRQGVNHSHLSPDLLAVTVDPVPSDYSQTGYLNFKSKSYACGRACWITGAVSGSLVQVFHGNILLGQGRADANGEARIILDIHMPFEGQQIWIKQLAPPGKTPLTGSPKTSGDTTLALPPNRQLPKVIVKNQPKGCDAAIRIENVIDGATVTVISKNTGIQDTALFDLDALWFILSNAVDPAGDRFTIFQSMENTCEMKPSDILEINAPAAATPSPPKVAPPCGGIPLIHIENLQGGSVLTIEITGRDSLQWEIPKDASSFDAPVDPLPFPATIKVIQSKCTFDTETQIDVTADGPGAPPELIEPVYACATAVCFKCTPKSFVEVMGDSGKGYGSLNGGALIWAENSPMRLDIHPSLTIPEKIKVRQVSCGGTEAFSPELSVQPHPSLKPILLSFIVEGSTRIFAWDAVEGAEISAWSIDSDGNNKELIGKSVVVAIDRFVYLYRPLRTTDHVWLTQKMCERFSEGPGPVPVVPASKSFRLDYDPDHPIPTVNSWDSQENMPHPLIIHSFRFDCNFNGDWHFRIDAENTEPNSDVQFTAGFTMQLPSPLSFGTVKDCMLSGSDVAAGLKIWNVPTQCSFISTGNSPQFKSPAFWQSVLNAPANVQFHLLVAWSNYLPPPEDPREFDDKDEDNKGNK